MDFNWGHACASRARRIKYFLHLHVHERSCDNALATKPSKNLGRRFGTSKMHSKKVKVQRSGIDTIKYHT